MGLSERDCGLGVIFVKDPSLCQAEFIGIQSGVPFTQQEQVSLYKIKGAQVRGRSNCLRDGA
jgi:hypothetical protein